MDKVFMEEKWVIVYILYSLKSIRFIEYSICFHSDLISSTHYKILSDLKRFYQDPVEDLLKSLRYGSDEKLSDVGKYQSVLIPIRF